MSKHKCQNINYYFVIGILTFVIDVLIVPIQFRDCSHIFPGNTLTDTAYDLIADRAGPPRDLFR